MGRIRDFCFLLLLLACTKMVVAKPVEPTYQFKLGRDKDAISAQKQGPQTVFVITSNSGIGDVSISVIKGQWPQNIAFRLQYAGGKGFEYLEGMQLSTARLWADGSKQDSGKVPFYLKDAAGKFDQESPPAGQLNILVEPHNGAIEILTPTNFATSSKQISLRWIDVYR